MMSTGLTVAKVGHSCFRRAPGWGGGGKGRSYPLPGIKAASLLPARARRGLTLGPLPNLDEKNRVAGQGRPPGSISASIVTWTLVSLRPWAGVPVWPGRRGGPIPERLFLEGEDFTWGGRERDQTQLGSLSNATIRRGGHRKETHTPPLAKWEGLTRNLLEDRLAHEPLESLGIKARPVNGDRVLQGSGQKSPPKRNREGERICPPGLPFPPLAPSKDESDRFGLLPRREPGLSRSAPASS